VITLPGLTLLPVFDGNAGWLGNIDADPDGLYHRGL